MLLQIGEHFYIETSEIRSISRYSESECIVTYRNGDYTRFNINVHKLAQILRDEAGVTVFQDKSLFEVEEKEPPPIPTLPPGRIIKEGQSKPKPPPLPPPTEGAGQKLKKGW